jgi:hypothetical protein
LLEHILYTVVAKQRKKDFKNGKHYSGRIGNDTTPEYGKIVPGIRGPALEIFTRWCPPGGDGKLGLAGLSGSSAVAGGWLVEGGGPICCQLTGIFIGITNLGFQAP